MNIGMLWLVVIGVLVVVVLLDLPDTLRARDETRRMREEEQRIREEKRRRWAEKRRLLEDPEHGDE